MIFTLGIFLRHLIRPWFPFLRDPDRLLQWLAGSSALILAVLVLRVLLKSKLSARWRYALWAVVLVRLLLPFQLPALAAVSTASLTPETPQSWEDHMVPMFPALPRAYDEDSAYDRVLEPGELLPGPGSDFYQKRSEDGATVTFYADAFSLTEIILSVWWVGVLAAGALLLACNLRFLMRLEERRRPLEVPDCPLPVYTAEGLPSPCLFGVFHPAVYLTPEAATLEPREREHILFHELTHHAHRDHIWALLRCLCLALHWYNPLVWLAAVLSKRDGELACDEGAVERLGEDRRVPYGRTLVGLSIRSARPADLFQCSTAMTGGKKTLRDRVTALARKPETRKTALFAAAALVALAAVFTFAGRVEDRLPNYHDFHSQVEQAQAIQVGEPLFSSQFYPDPITDADLLEEAKTILGTARDLLNVPEEMDLSDAEFVSSSVTLVNTERNPAEENRYLLYRWNNKTYVLVRDGSRYIPIVVMDASSGALTSIAKRQWERNMDTPEWRKEALSSALKSFAEIQFQFSHMNVVYPAITDPDLLEQAAEVLRTAGDPGDGTLGGGGAQVSIRDEKGERLANFPLSNREMIQTLDRLTMEQWARNDGFLNELTQEQLDRAKEAFRSSVKRPDGSTGPTEISCFFTSSYTDPTQIDLPEFLRYCPLGEMVDEQTEVEEYQSVLASSFWAERMPDPNFLLPTPMWRYPREKVSALLQQYAGVTVEELDWQPDQLPYLEEYDAFYNFTSDYGPGTFYCTGGRVEGDTVRLWSDPHGESGARSVLTLRQENGTWLIQSFRTAYPR